MLDDTATSNKATNTYGGITIQDSASGDRAVVGNPYIVLNQSAAIDDAVITNFGASVDDGTVHNDTARTHHRVARDIGVWRDEGWQHESHFPELLVKPHANCG